MAKSKAKHSSLAAMAASLDTKKREAPQVSTAPAALLREKISIGLKRKGPAASAPRAAKPSAPKAQARVEATFNPVGPPPKPAPRPAPVAAPKPAPVAAPVAAPKPAPVAAPKPAPVAAPKPAPVAVRPTFNPVPPAPATQRSTTPPSSVARGPALSSLARSPSPAPRGVPVSQATGTSRAAKVDSRRKYPRSDIQVRARLSLADDPTRVFEAALPTVNLSVGGLFLESSFFLKLGTPLLVELTLPPHGRTVRAKGLVVRVETSGEDQAGFALRFTEYLDGSEVVLATHFLSPVLREFITSYAKQHRFDASDEYIAHTADVLAAWELKKAELDGDVWTLANP
jgi:outer membrane biosynthesis protein TonB